MKKLMQITSLTLFISGLFGQGVTTAGLSGSVTDQDGNSLVGADVVAVYTHPQVHNMVLPHVVVELTPY